jgi:hypothetical protein
MIAVGLLAICATVAIEVDASEGIPSPEASAIAEELARAIEARTGFAAEVKRPAHAGKDSEVVALSFFGGLRKVRLVAVRTSASPGLSFRIEAQIPKDAQSRAPALREAAVRLFPEAYRAPAEGRLPVAPVVEIEPRKTKIAPWIAGGAGAVFLGGAIGFGLASLGAKHRLERESLDSPEATALDQRMRTDGLIGGLCLCAALGAIAAAVMLLFDE